MGQGSVDALVIGAGPYGLSLSAHFKHAGIEHKVVGKTMDAWHRMPRGMCLRSPARASSLSDPNGSLTLERFHEEQDVTLGPPVPLDSFLQYGHWFAARAGLEVDQRLVKNLTLSDGVFAASLEDGESVQAKRVVLAAGADPFRWVPPEFRGLPRDVASHPGDHEDFSTFTGKRVIVVGIGQSGVECAALLAESGASVRVVARAPRVRWLLRSARLHDSAFSSLLYSPSDVGPAGLSRLVSAPTLFRQFPSALRRKMVRRCARPAAGAWLIDRTREIPIETDCRIRMVEHGSGGVRIVLGDGRGVEADHLLLATGYQVNLAQYDFVAPDLLAAVKSVGGFPVLRIGMTSTVPGLHIVGWPATWTYGPLMRHVVGAEFTARTVTKRLVAALSRKHEAVRAEAQPATVA